MQKRIQIWSEKKLNLVLVLITTTELYVAAKGKGDTEEGAPTWDGYQGTWVLVPILSLTILSETSETQKHRRLA